MSDLEDIDRAQWETMTEEFRDDPDWLKHLRELLAKKDRGESVTQQAFLDALEKDLERDTREEQK